MKMSDPDYYPVYLTILAAIVAIGSSMWQVKTSKNDAKEREDKHMELIDSTRAVLFDTKNLLINVDSTLRMQHLTLVSASEIINQNIETIKNLQGSNEIPKVVMKFSDFGSASAVKVEFFIENSDKYPSNQIEIKMRDIKSPYNIKQIEESELVMDYFLKTREDMNIHWPLTFPLITVAPNDKRKFHTSNWKLETGTYSVLVQWKNGLYQVTIGCGTNDRKFSINGYSLHKGGVNNTHDNHKVFRNNEESDYLRIENTLPGNINELLKIREIEFKKPNQQRFLR